MSLTYDEAHLPYTEAGLPTLVKKHPQLWLKRLRKALGPTRPVRYYLVGEYGDQTFRPHYHAAVFGLSQFESSLVLSTWSMGMVDVGELTRESAQYVAGYVTKKMTAYDDPRLCGRYPEFARMSLRPGIGAGFVPVVAEALSTREGSQSIAGAGDVPTVLQHGSQCLPLGRYLRRKLREEVGFAETGGQEVTRLERVLAMRADPRGVAAYLEDEAKVERVKIRQMTTKAKIFAKKGSL